MSKKTRAKSATPKTTKPKVAAKAGGPSAVTKTAKAKSAKPADAALAEGEVAPSFTLPRDGGGQVSLSDYAGRKLVIFFYPRADTPGCTLEAVDFTRLNADFAACETAVIGVSADPLKAQDKFRDKHSLTMPLLSDETHAMLEAYGAWGEKSMYGKVFEGVLRSTVLVDRSGKITKIWRNVKVDGHADAVLAEARAL